MPVSLKKKSVNLLPSEYNSSSVSSRFIRWLTTTGRVTILITEIIVIAAFFSRFSLDRQNSDISESIKYQKVILDSVIDFEKQFTDIQTRLTSIKEIKAQTPEFDLLLKNIASHVPTDIVIDQLRMDRKSTGVVVDFVVNAYQEPALVSFINAISRNKTISSVKISRIEKKPKTGSYAVTLQLEFKNKTEDAKSSNKL